jgi:hypothetical protein
VTGDTATPRTHPAGNPHVPAGGGIPRSGRREERYATTALARTVEAIVAEPTTRVPSYRTIA